MRAEQLNPKILGQLLVMQSYINSLPDKQSIFSFVCKGLLDIPGISKVNYFENSQDESIQIQIQDVFPITIDNSYFGELIISISEYEEYYPYKDYIKNFIFMIGLVLEERNQRQLNGQNQLLLEKRIAERTEELSHEKENLVESQRRFLDLMYNIKLISVMIDADGNITFCNNYLLFITEYTANEVLGKNWFELFLPKEKSNHSKRTFLELMNGFEFPLNYENELLTKTGKTIIVSWNHTILHDNNQKIIGTASIGENITDRKHAEQIIQEKSEEIEAQNEEYLQLNEELTQTNAELYLSKQKTEESEERLRLMLKISNDSFVLINENAEQIFISDAAIRDTGFSIEELLGPIQNVIYPDDLDEVNKAWNEVLTKKKGEMVRVQYRHIHKYKDYIWYEAVAQNFIDHPAIKAVVVNVRDITKIKETELELIKAKEKAEESDKLKTAFLQNMSHEIRTPMNAIMGFSEILYKYADDKTKLQKFTNIIFSRCNDLLDIINDILDISKIESGQLPIYFESCILSELFTDITSFFIEYQKRINKQHIKLNFQISCTESHNIILTDKVKLKQIFINLITNAFKFTDEGTIECGCKFIENNNIYFYVSDTGLGIPLDKQEFIFERFSQLQQNHKKNIGGTGLGLPIVKALVNLLGGNIYIKSEPNNGSTFSFTIPYKSQKPTPNPQNSKENQIDKILNNKIILIVEDDPYNVEYLNEILSGLQLTILLAINGKEAMDIVFSQPIDLILMDIRLPDINGHEITKQIISNHPNLRIIAQTAYATQEDKQKALDAGCIDFISKPIKQNDLIFLLQKYLS